MGRSSGGLRKLSFSSAGGGIDIRRGAPLDEFVHAMRTDKIAEIFPNKNPGALRLRDPLLLKEKCSKGDSNTHRFPY